MNMPIGGLARRLVADKKITALQACRAIDLARHKQIPLATQLLEYPALSCNDIARATSQEFALPYLDITAFDGVNYPLELVDSKLLKKHQALPLLRRGNRLYLALADPGHPGILRDFEFHTGLVVEPIVVAADALSDVLQNLPSFGKKRNDAKMTATAVEIPSPVNGKAKHLKHQALPSADSSIVQFVNRLMLDAVQQGASDIHLEPYENSYRIRYRIDGTLMLAHTPKLAWSSRIASRIKVMAKLDIAERRTPQDGRISLRVGKARTVHIRISTLPTPWGEKIVMRLLDPEKTCPAIEELGFESCQEQHYLNALKQQQGMVLISGPTGSGKSVSLYAGLNLLNSGERNIATAEDPIEVSIEGINQVAVNNRVGLDFATALRAFLRQDPDVVMVGEIRDLETAEIAVRAAQTGHLVLSTLHTNGAAEIVTRLRSMGIPPYNLATSVKLVIAQRLARRLCRYCKELVDLPENLLKSSVFNRIKYKELRVYKAVGCERCNEGFKGRIGIYEVVPITPAMTQIIMAGGNAIQLSEEARKEGFPDLREAALFKVAQGLISLEEAYRLT